MQHSLSPLLLAKEEGMRVKWGEFQSALPQFEGLGANQLDFS